MEFGICVWGKKNVYKFLIGKREGRRPLGKLRRRWECNTKLDVKVIDGKA